MNKLIWTYTGSINNSYISSYAVIFRAAWEKYCKNCDIIHVNINNIQSFLPDVPSIIWNFSLKEGEKRTVEFREEIIKAFLLEKFGGVIASSFIFPINDFSPVFDMINKNNLFIMSDDNDECNFELYGCCSHNSIVTKVCNNIRSYFSDNTVFSYNDRSEIFKPFFDNNDSLIRCSRKEYCMFSEKKNNFWIENTSIESMEKNNYFYMSIPKNIFNETNEVYFGTSACSLWHSKTRLGELLRYYLNEKDVFFEKTYELKKDGVESYKNILQKRKIPVYQPDKILYRTADKKNSSLKIGVVVEEKHFFELEYEAEIIPLTPSNYSYQIKYNKPDFILIESFWKDSTGEWEYAFSPNSSLHDTFRTMLELAEREGVPAVLWLTKGVEYHDVYAPVIPLFREVFCADTREYDLLKKSGTSAHVLLPCIQPAICNPFMPLNKNTYKKYNVLFDGVSDMERMPELAACIEKFVPLKIRCIESRGYLLQNKIEALNSQQMPFLKKCYLGYTDMWSRVAAIKNSRIYLGTSISSESRTQQLWKLMEAAGMRVPVIWYGEAPSEPAASLACVCSTLKEALIEATSMQQDMFYGERLAQRAWRLIHSSHTFSHRIHSICQVLGVRHDWNPYPLASMVSPTMRPDMLDGVLATYNRQTYPHKELIIVCHGFDKRLAEEKAAGIKNVTVCALPADVYAGTLLNWGNHFAKGEYVFRIDDDDIYFDHYIEDMILMAMSVDADVFGKHFNYLSFDGNKIYHQMNFNCKTVLYGSNIDSYGISGNTLSGKKHVIDGMYPDDAIGAADFIIKMNLGENVKYAVTDEFNMVVMRHDEAFHTWKMSDKFKKSLNATELTVDVLNV